jgi:hypothetical protein
MLTALQRLNHPNLLRLRLEAPDLKTNKGVHYAEVYGDGSWGRTESLSAHHTSSAGRAAGA